VGLIQREIFVQKNAPESPNLEEMFSEIVQQDTYLEFLLSSLTYSPNLANSSCG
jgi:hypothetical protein